MTEASRLTTIAQNQEHVAEGLAMFYRQFSASPKLQALASAWLVQVQEIEDELWNVLVNTTLLNATDDALDQLGRILKFPRGVLGNTDYRIVLRALVLALRSSGTPEELFAICVILFNGTTFSYTEGWASIVVEPHAVLSFSAEIMVSVLRRAKCGGVQLQLIDPPQAESDLFTFSSSAFFVTSDSARGWSNVAQDTGGYLTGVVE